MGRRSVRCSQTRTRSVLSCDLRDACGGVLSDGRLYARSTLLDTAARMATMGCTANDRVGTPTWCSADGEADAMPCTAAIYCGVVRRRSGLADSPLLPEEASLWYRSRCSTERTEGRCLSMSGRRQSRNAVRPTSGAHPGQATAVHPRYNVQERRCLPRCGRPLLASSSRGSLAPTLARITATRKHDRYAVAQRDLEPAFGALVRQLGVPTTRLSDSKHFCRHCLTRAKASAARGGTDKDEHIETLTERLSAIAEAFCTTRSLGIRTDLEKRADQIDKELRD